MKNDIDQKVSNAAQLFTATKATSEPTSPAKPLPSTPAETAPAATPFVASDSDLPRELFNDPTPPERKVIHARYEVLRQARELGLSITDEQITLSVVILFASWQDEAERKHLGNAQGIGRTGLREG